ncbi:MAG: 50S ribosomal protein L9 [Bacteroidetes bacterium]|jgi:large subunit ribosomal protein L9|uniref:Large ribosomal subunit protein bL9 n=1 Tax=Rhodohalobacter sulfatireducens TaxID=2911366 RepID=A0ABS9KBR0_9BACT|nr:50S ribosomal protein L9 [Rhodohalobacter sulfatireducens]MCG2588295.1 50S ribosomal protein L9 [Rhodohalobacter sulfatireducens]MDR9365737.1 50S ribosomal protein L9 [Balneolaceae bacterium]MDR9409454.1 50S ribosomal protein L9 [Balneolaceae bacterium]NBC66846.1 50S ribosomal protein L9 [Bacteroidota bacterium]
MKLILKEDVEKLGSAGDLVDVKPGYGRNYLIPQAKAVMATEGAIKHFEQMKREAELRAELTVEKAKELAQQLENTSVTIPVTVGEDDRIHGTVTNIQIAEALEERDILIDRKKISIDQDIKTLGEYTATIDLMGDLNPQVKVWVVKADS